MCLRVGEYELYITRKSKLVLLSSVFEGETLLANDGRHLLSNAL